MLEKMGETWNFCEIPKGLKIEHLCSWESIPFYGLADQIRDNRIIGIFEDACALYLLLTANTMNKLLRFTVDDNGSYVIDMMKLSFPESRRIYKAFCDPNKLDCIKG